MTADERLARHHQLAMMLEVDTITLLDQYNHFQLPGSTRMFIPTVAVTTFEHEALLKRYADRLHEFLCREKGRWEMFSPIKMADEASQRSWYRDELLQLPQPILDSIQNVPLVPIPWGVQEYGGDLIVSPQ